MTNATMLPVIAVATPAAGMRTKNKYMITSIEREFLEQSNAIEGVFDKDSLDQAILAWEYLKRQKKLDIGAILKTHKILMLHQPLQPNEKGYFRQIRVWVGGREVLEWRKIRNAMEAWIRDAAASVKVAGQNTHIKLDHVNFERVHPFVDGNGRVGRMLMNWQRIMAGLPILIIRDEEKSSYYEWFE